MSRTINAIERHMILPVRSETGLSTARIPRREFGLQSRAAKLVAEWQQRGPETLSGYAVGKVRLAFASTHSAITLMPVGAA